MGTAAMATPKKRTKPGPKPSPEGRRQGLLALKCRPEWKEWVIEYARHKRINPSQLVDHALEAFARQDGFTPPPER